MKKDFEEEEQSIRLVSELVECLQYEAFVKLDEGAKEKPRRVFQAFLNLGWIKSHLRDRFEEIRQELYEEAEERLLAPDFPKVELSAAAEGGLMYGVQRMLPRRISPHFIHYGFVAELVGLEIGDRIRYVECEGWELWKDRSWHRRPKERGIVGLIYEVMMWKVNTWREILEIVSEAGGTGGWLEKLEKNINDPDWLSKVEELLLRVDYFGVEIVSGQPERQA